MQCFSGPEVLEEMGEDGESPVGGDVGEGVHAYIEDLSKSSIGIETILRLSASLCKI